MFFPEIYFSAICFFRSYFFSAICFYIVKSMFLQSHFITGHVFFESYVFLCNHMFFWNSLVFLDCDMFKILYVGVVFAHLVRLQ